MILMMDKLQYSAFRRSCPSHNLQVIRIFDRDKHENNDERLIRVTSPEFREACCEATLFLASFAAAVGLSSLSITVSIATKGLSQAS